MIIKRMFYKLFPPKEVRETISNIEEFSSKSKSTEISMVHRYAIKLAEDSEKTVYSIRQDGMHPEHLALVLITNIVGTLISSGQFHTYRGILSGNGNQLLVIWNEAIDRLVAGGYYSKDEETEDQNWIKRQIKSAG